MEKCNISSQFIIAERIQLLDKLTQLRGLLSGLSALIRDCSLPAYSPQVAPFDPDKIQEHALARDVIGSAIKTLDYKDEQEANESICFPGFMYASVEMLELIATINQCKEAIQEVFKKYSKIQVTQFGKNFMLLDKFILQGTVESRLNKKETYRKIYCASQENAVKTIGFTWANVPITRQLSTENAIKFVKRHQVNETCKEADIAKLAELNPNELLAHERRAPVKSRINVTYSNKKLFNDGKKMYTGVLPFFIHEDNIGTTTVYSLTSSIASNEKQKRRRVKLEAAPYCQFSPIFRYKAAFRQIAQTNA